jgi:hypothetical protein
MLDQASLITLVVGVLVAALGLAYRYYKVTDPIKSWLEMFLSVIAAIIVAFALGKFGALPSDPVKVVQFFLENAAVVFAIVQLIYNALKQALPQSQITVKAFGK